jgi:hypothetical protein
MAATNSPTRAPAAAATGHILGPAVVIAALSMVLAVGLKEVGLISRLDSIVAGVFATELGAPKVLLPWIIWLAASGFSLGIGLALLAVRGRVQRFIISVTTLMVVIAWAPVLVLAAHAPEIGAVIVATFWAGFCAWIYAEQHPHPPRSKP